MRAPGVTARISRLARIGPAGIVLLALLAACSDDKPGTAGAEPGAAPGPAAAAFVLAGPADAVLDDEVVLQAVVASTRTGAPLPPELAKLPPRVSPARVGVRAVHDYLIAATESAADWPKLLDVLDELARGDRTKVDAGALASLVAAWRKWSPADRAAEAKLATRYTRALDLLRGQGPGEGQ